MQKGDGVILYVLMIPQLIKSTVARWIWLMNAKFAMLIRDYFGEKTKGYDAAMRNATRGHPPKL